MKPGAFFSWGQVARLGLVQAAIGSVVVLMTSTLNRVMAVELGWAAAVPGALVTLHFAIQLLFRPRMGFVSDHQGRRTSLILRGMVLLAAAGTAAAGSVALASTHRMLGLTAAVLAFSGIGIGVSAAGTPLLALLAQRVEPDRRARAAAIVWLMMIAGFVITTLTASQFLEPFSFGRLVAVTGTIGVVACAVAAIALAGLEPPGSAGADSTDSERPAFRQSVRALWGNPVVRRFSLFIFVSMLGYSAQDLILEPFAGVVFSLSPAASTRISSMHQGGMLVGMLAAAALAARWGGLAVWAAGGCIASALAFLALALTPAYGSLFLLKLTVFSLGVANGTFAIGAIGSMMLRARGDTAGLRMGIFGAAQAGAYALGGFLGAAGSDVARVAFGSPARGYMAVFLAEAVLFVGAALLVVGDPRPQAASALLLPEDGDSMLAVLR